MRQEQNDAVKCSHVLNTCIPDSDNVSGGIDSLQCWAKLAS